MSLPDPGQRDSANAPLKTVELGKITVFNYPIDTNIFAAVCSLPLFPANLIPCLIALNTASDSPQFLRFHAMQSIIVNGLFVVGSTVLGFLAAIPFIGFLFGLALALFTIIYVLVSLKLCASAFLGQKQELPMISDYARQFAK